jgi:hypothetical protein
MKYYTSTPEFNCGIDLHAHQLAHNCTPAKQTRRSRDFWEEQLLKAENHPLRQIALRNDLAMIRHFDEQISRLEAELNRQTKRVACREYTLLKTLPGVGEALGLTILYEVGDIHRFPTVKDFLSYGRLVKGTVASAGKIKGLRGAKLGNPHLCFTPETVEGDRTGRQRPPWFPSFANEPRPPEPRSADITSERPYLLEHPPQRQVRRKTGAPTSFGVAVFPLNG